MCELLLKRDTSTTDLRRKVRKVTVRSINIYISNDYLLFTLWIDFQFILFTAIHRVHACVSKCQRNPSPVTPGSPETPLLSTFRLCSRKPQAPRRRQSIWDARSGSSQPTPSLNNFTTFTTGNKLICWVMLKSQCVATDGTRGCHFMGILLGDSNSRGSTSSSVTMLSGVSQYPSSSHTL